MCFILSCTMLEDEGYDKGSSPAFLFDTIGIILNTMSTESRSSALPLVTYALQTDKVISP